MNTARKVDYEYYDNLAETLKNNAQEEAIKRYNAHNAQAAHLRFISSGAIIVLVFVLILPFSYILFRNAKIHQAQNDIYRINLAVKDYETKSNEIKERLESNTSLDELELYAKEQISMIKASSASVIILKDINSQVIDPDIKFSIDKPSNDYGKW